MTATQTRPRKTQAVIRAEAFLAEQRKLTKRMLLGALITMLIVTPIALTLGLGLVALGTGVGLAMLIGMVSVGRLVTVSQGLDSVQSLTLPRSWNLEA